MSSPVNFYPYLPLVDGPDVSSGDVRGGDGALDVPRAAVAEVVEAEAQQALGRGVAEHEAVEVVGDLDNVPGRRKEEKSSMKSNSDWDEKSIRSSDLHWLKE